MSAMKTFFEQVRNSKHALMGAALATMVSTGMAYGADGNKWPELKHLESHEFVSALVADTKDERVAIERNFDPSILKERANPVAEVDRKLDIAFTNMKFALVKLADKPFQDFGKPQTVDSLIGNPLDLSHTEISLKDAKEVLMEAEDVDLPGQEIYENLAKRSFLLGRMEDRLGKALEAYYEGDVEQLSKEIAVMDIGFAQHDKLSADDTLSLVKKM